MIDLASIDFGLPVTATESFARDPEIKTESGWSGPIPRDQGHGALHDADIPADHGVSQQIRALLPCAGNDLRADAGRVTHGNQQGRGHGVQAGLGMSMNRCSSPSERATCPATAGAP